MMMKKMCPVHKVAAVLLFVGGLNWLLVAFGWNLVEMIFGAGSMLAKVVYVLVGLSALSMLGLGKCCMKGGMCACEGDNCGHCGTGDAKPAAPGMDKKM